MAEPKRWMFEGEMRTVTEVRAMVPRLSDHAVRKHLAAGRNTRMAMMAHDGKAASARGTRRAHAMRGRPVR